MCFFPIPSLTALCFSRRVSTCKAYVPAWSILIVLLVVFSGASSFAFAILRFRSNDANLGWALLEQALWIPFFLVFFGGALISPLHPSAMQRRLILRAVGP